MSQPDVAEQNIQMWKVKKLIKSLDSARGWIPFHLILAKIAWLMRSFLQGRYFYDQSYHPAEGT